MDQNEQDLNRVILRLNGKAWGIATGLLCGGGLFLATILLVLQNGPNAGQHLSLLRVFFPGYQVSFGGAVVGFVYGYVVGYGTGRIIGGVYNRLVRSSP